MLLENHSIEKLLMWMKQTRFYASLTAKTWQCHSGGTGFRGMNDARIIGSLPMVSERL